MSPVLPPQKPLAFGKDLSKVPASEIIEFWRLKVLFRALEEVLGNDYSSSSCSLIVFFLANVSDLIRPKLLDFLVSVYFNSPVVLISCLQESATKVSGLTMG